MCWWMVRLLMTWMRMTQLQVSFTVIVNNKDQNSSGIRKTWCNYPKQCEPRHDKTNTAKTQISLGIHPVWSESSLCTQWIVKDPRFLHAGSEDSDQTVKMPRLIRVFAECILILWFYHVTAHVVLLLSVRPKGADGKFNSVESDQTAHSVWSDSTLFDQICPSENLGSLRY